MKSLLITLLAGISISNAVESAESSLPELESEARAIVQRFAGTLKPTLLKAVQTDGAASAISVCAQQAPEIAKALSQETGWHVRRVSLKPRNAGSAMPDSFEREILRSFEARLQSGETAASLSDSAVADDRYRYLQAQTVEALCLVCHGTSLAPDVEAALKEYYPEDRATGYQLGEIRGAFSLSRPVE